MLAATAAASVEYYRQIRKAQKEYEKAKDIVEDIVLSFNRELKREADRLELIAYKVEGSSAKADTSLKKMANVEKKMAPLENQVSAISQNNTNILSGLTSLESKIKDIEDSQETLRVKITGFEEQIQKFTVAPEIKGESVIPIKRDKAMAALTDTEIAVLEMLSSEGPKTAPEVKDRVHLSREHTARLMKKLYEEGYLEREVGKIPFRYSIKKEMEKLLKKTENSQQT
ncbi:MAG: MarR family transcriptional regulator [Candidatus Bathyarchaeota archaeon]|nr:MarR family transcriptional regulator [Candidatus Bathyarchaeota archaeon]